MVLSSLAAITPEEELPFFMFNMVMSMILELGS
jgi:hypothetical protein